MRRSYTPDPVRTRIIAGYLAGMSNRGIAKKEGVDRDTVSRVLSSDEVAEMKQKYRLQLLALVPLAIAAYERLLKSKDDRVLAAAASKILVGLEIFSEDGVCPVQTSPSQDHDQRKHLILGQLTEMMLRKERSHGIQLPPMFDELKSAELQLGPVRCSQ